MNEIPAAVLKQGGAALLVLGFVGVFVALLWSPSSWARLKWRDYEADLERRLRALYLKTTGPIVARTQLTILLVGTVGLFLHALLSSPDHFFDVVQRQDTWLRPVAFALAAAFLPILFLRIQRDKRREAVEKQLDGWLQVLSNALTATPSLGDAIESSRELMQDPMAQELDVLTKEVRLGTPLEEAINSMAERIDSKVFSAATVAILVGRRTGGNLSAILGESAAALREMQRLEGVIRTKTIGAKVQIFAIAVFPFGLGIVINMMNPGHLDPLLESSIGGIVLGVGVVTWLLGLLWARVILMVRI